MPIYRQSPAGQSLFPRDGGIMRNVFQDYACIICSDVVLEANFYGLGLKTYGLGLEGPGLGLEGRGLDYITDHM